MNNRKMNNNKQNHLSFIESIREKLIHAPALSVEQAAQVLSDFSNYDFTAKEQIAKLSNLKPKK